MNGKTFHPIFILDYALRPIHIFTKEVYDSDLPDDTFDG